MWIWLAARLGERWVVRVRLADGSATDLIGWLDEIGGTTLRVTAADQRRTSSTGRPSCSPAALRRLPAGHRPTG